MTRHSIQIETQLEKLTAAILSLGALVEESVKLSIKSFEEMNPIMANEVIRSDNRIDQMEVEIEEECLKIFALYQPVANDLRLIVTILKVNSDLERIADLAVNIAERTIDLARHKQTDPPPPLVQMTEMAQKACWMLRSCLDAFVNLDAVQARQVCLADDEVDAILRIMYKMVENKIRATPEQMDVFIPLISAARYIERIADHATNIAEDVIYMVKGEIIRHKPEIFQPPPGQDGPA